MQSAEGHHLRRRQRRRGCHSQQDDLGRADDTRIAAARNRHYVLSRQLRCRSAIPQAASEAVSRLAARCGAWARDAALPLLPGGIAGGRDNTEGRDRATCRSLGPGCLRPRQRCDAGRRATPADPAHAIRLAGRGRAGGHGLRRRVRGRCPADHPPGAAGTAGPAPSGVRSSCPPPRMGQPRPRHRWRPCWAPGSPRAPAAARSSRPPPQPQPDRRRLLGRNRVRDPAWHPSLVVPSAGTRSCSASQQSLR